MQTELAFRALSDLTRLRILRLVSAMELAVGEIAQVLGQSQPRVSRHVSILCDAGLTDRRREGSWIFLRARSSAKETIAGQLHQLLALAERSDPELAAVCDADRLRLASIRSLREDQAQEYFSQHAETWDELRRMHSSDERVENELISVLAGSPIGKVLDIGTGTGRIAELLAGQADHVVALDKSPAMLRLARARLQNFGSKITMIQGDFASLPVEAASVDTVLFHQVLHFAQNPAHALIEAARVNRPGGRVVIVDFAAHQREELRERFAHARLGFTDAQIETLLVKAGYDPVAPVALEEGELIVKIWIGHRLATNAAAAA